MRALVLLGLLAACGGSDEVRDDDDGASGSGTGGTTSGATTSSSTSTGGGANADAYMRATLLLTAGGERLLDEPAEIQASEMFHMCVGDDADGWGVAVAWETGAPPAEGDHPLDGVGTYPQMLVSFPKPSGGFRFKFVGNGTLTIGGLGADFIEGSFDAIQFTPDDPDDIVSGVSNGTFRCQGAL